MQEVSLEVESNILASNRLKVNSDQQIYDRKGKKEVIPAPSTSQSADSKIDEMAKLVKILITKLNKLKLEKNSNRPAQEGERNPNNPNQFRHQFAPRFIPRQRRNNDIQRERRENEDQIVPPPLQNYIINETEEGEDMQDEYLNQDMNYFAEFSTEGFSTEDEYLNSEFFDANIYQTENDLGLEVSAELG